MLDPEYLRRLTEGSEQIASLLHTELVKIIVQAIVTRMERGDKYRLTARDRWMLEVLQAAGYLRGDLEREIAAKTKLMLQEIREAFEDAGVRSLAWDDAVYIAAGLEPTPLRQSPQLIRLLQRGYEKTAGEWVNFTGTTADAAQQLFIRECDKAYSLVAGGGMSHAQAVRQAVEAVAKEGVIVTYPTGHKDTVETAVARAVRTGVGQACGEMSIARMREMHWKIVLVSAHLGARTGDGGENHTNHFWWQGKFYRLDDEDGSGTEDAAAENTSEPLANPGEKSIMQGREGYAEQEGYEPVIPREYEGNFNDFDPLTIGPEERTVLADLHRQASSRRVEFGQGKTSGRFTRVFTSDDPNGVQIPEDVLSAPSLCLYHAHTNVTPLSASDFRLLTRENINSVMVITSDKSVFAASIGNGWRPTPEEFDEAVRIIGVETDQALMDDPSFFSWSLEERNYAAIRERAYRIARNFEWHLEGGKL